MDDEINDIAIIGGGIAGLTLAILLSRSGFRVQLFEKKNYPFHRVCGEYVSNEVLNFLKSHDLFPDEYRPSMIKRFRLTAINGRSAEIRLPLGGFGISRFTLDHFLAREASRAGCKVTTGTSVTDIGSHDTFYNITTDRGDKFLSRLVVGCFGKRSNLDKKLNRSFFFRPSPYLAVKYHLKTDFPSDTIALHNFKDGYCGISMVENNIFNLCYLSHRKNLKGSGSIKEMEENLLCRNPHLKYLFRNSEFLFDKPLTINEISFAPKPLSGNGILMCGDAAGMITPLCGNGMAMGIHGAKILHESICAFRSLGHSDRELIEREYGKQWKRMFQARLRTGRIIQGLFGREWASNLGVSLLRSPLAHLIVKQTHGQPI